MERWWIGGVANADFLAWLLTSEEEGVAVVLVEQRVDAVLKLADHVAFMVAGRVEEARDVAGLTAGDPLFRTYVGAVSYTHLTLPTSDLV